MPRWEWACEDEEEAIGLATVLRRAGVRVQHDHGPTAIVRADDRDAAHALASRMLSHYARVHGRERATALDRRDRRGLLLLAIGLAVLAIAAVLLGA